MTQSSLQSEIQMIGRQAKAAAQKLFRLSGSARQRVILAMPDKLLEIRESLFRANQQDVADAESNGLPGPLVKRLQITDKIFSYMLDRLKKVASMPDPVGRILEGHIRPNGLKVQKISVPLGVI